MRGLDADDHARIPARHVGRGLGGHVRQILFELSAAHAVADDVQKGEDAGGRAIDDALLEILEVAPARSAGVDNGRHARARRDDVRVDAVVAGIRALLTRSRVHVRVNVDEAGSDEQPSRVNRLRRIRRIDLRRDRGNLPGRNRDVSNGVDVVARIDQMPALQQQVVLFCAAAMVGAARIATTSSSASLIDSPGNCLLDGAGGSHACVHFTSRPEGRHY